MQTRNLCLPFVLLCLWHPVHAQEPFTASDREQAQAKAFLPVYYHYIETINTQGVAGLRTIATSNFTLKWDHDTRTGEKAFVEMRKYLSDAPKSPLLLDAFSVTLRRLTLVGDRAIAQTEETRSFHPKEDPTGKISATSYWTQTWRKMPQGWRLAVWKMGSEKLSGPKPVLMYTINWKPQKAGYKIR